MGNSESRWTKHQNLLELLDRLSKLSGSYIWHMWRIKISKLDLRLWIEFADMKAVHIMAIVRQKTHCSVLLGESNARTGFFEYIRFRFLVLNSPDKVWLCTRKWQRNQESILSRCSISLYQFDLIEILPHLLLLSP